MSVTLCRMRTWIVMTTCVLTTAAGVHALSQADSRSVWTGVYSEQQAIRGKTAYRTHCSYCHGEDLLAVVDDFPVAVPALYGYDFEERFSGKSVGHLLRRVTTTMPYGKANSLTPEGYADIVAYVLKENGFPSATQELPADPAAADGILITAKK